MGENDDEKYNQAGQIFENFVQATTCKGTIQAFNILTRQLELDPLDCKNFYSKLKSRVTTWKAKALWNKLDKRASHKEYKRGKSCMNTKCLIIGGGPCGLRTAIELAFLGAKVVVVEKRDTFSRNNVLHLWPFTIHDLRGLGAKKFYGKFCAGSIDHISIRQLQLILFKVALMLGVEIHVNLEFVKVLEPPEDQENQKIGWRAEFLPVDHPLSEYEFDVIVGADGRRNTLEGFRRKEFRGKLAIAITANFINRNTTAEAKVEEISGVAFIFNQKFFQDLKEETGIDLENIVYYKDSTHYFVMTAKKQSLLDKGVIINDYIDTESLLCGENVNQSNLLSYAREAADFATNYQLPSLDFAINHYGQPDVAMFDFTSMYASENAALVRERHRHQLLVALVGDSLLEPFWPMGTGCARGFLAAFDTAWMVRSWAQGKPPLEILAERESIYRLLPQTTPENINKNFDQYTIDPGTRYPNLNSSCVRPHQVKQLYVTNELQQCSLERASSIRRSVNLSRHESDIRPNKLLTWCQKQTEGYRNVNITDLTTSWKSGLALCAIIHRFRPDLIDFDALNEEDIVKNNQLAFDVAEREFGIPPLTTGKEVGSAEEPDKLSMVMYLSKFYELFRGTPLRTVDAGDKQNGESNELCSAKSSNFIFNNYINLTLPRKRVPKVEGKTEENETNKRRRKGLFGVFEEASGFSSQETSVGKEQNDGREGINQNKVKSMATQLLAKFEENTPNTIFRRQGSLRKEFPQSIGGSDICYFCKKRVYVMERLSAEGHFFHRECFKCEICSTTLRLGIYAFDVEEGKFYCKPHFRHCKISNKHRKRRATLQVQCKEATEAWKKEELRATESTTDSTLTTASSPEDRSPGFCQPKADEPTSPKKAKSVLEHLNVESWFSSTDPEWATVRVIPEEEMTEHNLLAVRVMVTSDASSSEGESDFNGNSSSSEVSEGQTSLLEPPACPSPPRRWTLLARSSMAPEESHRASKVIDVLQRANSFHSTALNKYQSWRRKIQTNFPLLSNKKPGLRWKDSSASCQSSLGEDHPQAQLASYKKPPEVTRGHVKPYSPEFQRKARERPQDVHPHVPRCPFQSKVKGSPQISTGNGAWAAGFSECEDTDGDAGTYTGQGWNEVKKSCTSESEDFNGNTKVMSSLHLKEKDEKNTRHLEEKLEQEQKEAKKRLVLCTEQQAMYDSNGVYLGGTTLQCQSKKMLGISKEKNTEWRRGVFKPSGCPVPLLFVDDVPPALPVDMKDALRSPDKTAKEHSAGQPKSPLRLIANAIRRSILEPLTSSPEGLKQDSDSKTKASSEQASFSFPSILGHKNTNNNRASNSQLQELQVRKQAGEHLGCGSLLSSASKFSASSEERSPSDTKDVSFPVYSPHSRPSKTPNIPQKPTCTRMEDVPGLLEKFTFNETPSVAPKDDVLICNEKYPLASSQEPWNTPKDSLHDSAQKGSLSLFERLRSKICEREGNFSVSSLPFMNDHSAEDRLHYPSTGCELPPVRKQTVEYFTSSSDEDEFEFNRSLTYKAKRSLRRRRKLEKETKQLIKQEELKRLHKAQAIQRQLEELEERQRALEVFGVQLERELRGESVSGTQDETQLLHEWFELVLEKNKLMRYESELLIVAQELELEDHQSRLEQKLREKMAIDDSLKNEMDLNEEDEIFIEMMKVVEERDKLVSALEEQRVKEQAEDQCFESILLSRGCQLSGI
ncbi:F-actin-monooxygenase MICAL2 isoform X1 [Centrocercus urophasianus]|uniref:F-actin-monooxygenase MICAL2 isoform X1 n=1 Tax=Centrocercus urophasianus TaxID=9002 RepID=UPI001C6479E1|nr:F-actin-monooxygenase MICAL2 isoform X1 [Centrocercus urophasianus]XP_042669688.1 F-actin-monooxygenase MICAL2 isoform X1 [Centrocercus urophasianus]XP_042669689.1 F-actin-monooxygenase MICAL2 isoform X1 [Centrocercus urophasianus]XP_042669690.1 F-actin-monooxygenase MICAL2 isoform X1 [Centrocercus urophasianus]XP_042669691.1 F-actin-monooxygenase MICAL2 isoform X1 [Centrocercus urophasianus]